MRRSVSTGGLGFVLPVLLSLQSFFGVCVGSNEGVGDGSVRYVSYSYREKSGWSSSAGVVLLLDDLESPAVIEAPDLFCLGDENGHSAIQAYIDLIGVPLVAKPSASGARAGALFPYSAARKTMRGVASEAPRPAAAEAFCWAPCAPYYIMLHTAHGTSSSEDNSYIGLQQWYLI